MSDRDFSVRPARKERLKDVPADSPVQGTHPIYRAAPTDPQIGHVEIFQWVIWVLTAQSQQLVECYAKPLLGVTTEVLLNEGRYETVEARGHRRMGCLLYTSRCV